MNQKRKNAFTLIELLAVIVILAIIALIAVPVIMNIINKANKSAFKDTAYGIISAGELYFAEQQLNPLGMSGDVTIQLPDATKKLELKGEVPTGEILITKDGKIAIMDYKAWDVPNGPPTQVRNSPEDLKNLFKEHNLKMTYLNEQIGEDIPEGKSHYLIMFEKE